MPASDSTKCIRWGRAISSSGYGAEWFRGRVMGAHRAAWIRANGDIPTGMVVCHSCDNRWCVNPDHLFLGTQADNLRDMAQKGRRLKRITPEQREEILARVAGGETQTSVANDLGVGLTTINYHTRRAAHACIG